MAYLKNLNTPINEFKNLPPINAERMPITRTKTPSIFNGIPNQTIRENASTRVRIIPNRNLKIMTTMSAGLSIGTIDFWLIPRTIISQATGEGSRKTSRAIRILQISCATR